MFINFSDTREAYATGDPIYGVGSGGGFSSGRIGGFGTEVALPIKLVSFEAKMKSQSAIIVWKTASETNNDYFNLERSSNGIDFEEIERVRGAGNSTVENTYSYTDYNILPGTSYYRLKQTDYDGHYEYFKIVRIKNNELNNSLDDAMGITSIYPNPFSNSFTAEIKSKHAGTIEVQFLTINGQVIDKVQIETGEGKTFFDYNDEKNIAPGIYFVRIFQDGELSQAFKIIKK